MIGTNADGEEGSNNDDGFNHQGEDFSDSNLDEVPDDINNEDASDDDNDYILLLENPTCGIIIQNDPSTHMLSVDSDVVHASSFPEYPNIISFHRLTPDPESKELVVGQQFPNKEECCSYSVFDCSNRRQLFISCALSFFAQ